MALEEPPAPTDPPVAALPPDPAGAFDPAAPDKQAAILAVVAALMAFRFHRSLIEVVLVMAALGMITHVSF